MPALDKKFKHDIDVVVDRIVVRPDIAHAARRFARAGAEARRRPWRSSNSPTAARCGAKANKGRNETAERLIFSEKFACPVSGFTIPEIEPRLFSFNNPFGACPACDGLGVEQHIDAELVVPDKDATLRKGAIAPWAKSSLALLHADAQGARQALQFTLDTKWKDLPKKVQDVDPLRLRRGRDQLHL